MDEQEAQKGFRMKKGIIGIKELQIEHSYDAATTINMRLVAYPGYDVNHLLKEDWGQLFPGKVVVKCKHCGQHGVVQTPCKHCGAPIDE
jgi:hypothetical protein